MRIHESISFSYKKIGSDRNLKLDAVTSILLEKFVGKWFRNFLALYKFPTDTFKFTDESEIIYPDQSTPG